MESARLDGLAPAAPRGRAVGVDVGRARVGLALTDPDALIATPLRTVRRDLKRHGCVAAVVREVLEADAVVVYVGLPMNLAGKATASTDDAVRYAARLRAGLTSAGSAAPVHLVDERLSTVSAQRQLSASGRTTRNSRDVIDQAAAVAILQAAADAQRRTGVFSGEPVDARDASGAPDASDAQTAPDAQEGRP